MPEDSWHAARLIPTSGINGAEEQERRATSALLAVMSAVREFGRAITQPYGAPAGSLQTFIEVPFTLGDAKCFPDGLIHVTRGQRQWNALVEVKTGSNDLQAEQLDRYLDVAKEQGFDALITISNEIPPVPGQHPTGVDKRKLKKVALHHLPWSEVLTIAVMQKEYRGVADPEQAWILGELIRYLEHPRSGALEFSDMGSSWVRLREAIGAGTLRATDAVAAEVAARFDALVRFAGLKLGRKLGTEIVPALNRRELAEPATRTQTLVSQLVTTGAMTSALQIPGAIGALYVTADLRASKVVCHVDVGAPREGRPTTRVNWLVRQLAEAPETVRVESFAAYSRGPGHAELLKSVREKPALLIGDPSKELKTFRVAATSAAGAKRGTGRGSFIDSVLEAIDGFYVQVIQNLRPWMPAPPKLRSQEEVVEVEPVRSALVSTAISSQDEPQIRPDAAAEPVAVNAEEPVDREATAEQEKSATAPPMFN
ncbi:stress response protein [Actinoplanes sp. NPDC049118]|uniref:stress response protein n=1 Tax=Actinoplanes sp. NPDC049118 TaxID=3155769 RepID=UPI0033E0C51D